MNERFNIVTEGHINAVRAVIEDGYTDSEAAITFLGNRIYQGGVSALVMKARRLVVQVGEIMDREDIAAEDACNRFSELTTEPLLKVLISELVSKQEASEES